MRPTPTGLVLLLLLFGLVPLLASWAIDVSCGQSILTWTICCSLVLAGFSTSAIMHAQPLSGDPP